MMIRIAVLDSGDVDMEEHPLLYITFMSPPFLPFINIIN